jgi:putative zinc ribbon protein
MTIRSTYCQSCSMPMSRDAHGGGTHADGSRSPMYCSHCYAHGRFTLPDISVEQMQGIVREKLRDFGMPAVLGWFFTRRIPKLARWNGARGR